VRNFTPDIVLCFDLLSAWLTARVPARRLVWLGDLRFQTALYHAIYAARENPARAVHIPSNWLGCRAWKKIYGETLRGADQVIVSSHSSIGALTPLGIRSEYEPYPWPETTDEARSGTDPCPPETPTFLFFGSLGGLGSRSALHLLTCKVFPLLRRCWGKGGFRVLIAGRGTLPGWALQAIAGKPEFETLGFVEDLDGLVARCHAVLVPIDVPVGNRSRILAAMARRALVIAHANAALGNPDLVDGETCYLASSPAGFVDRMQRAVRDRQAASAITARALERFRSRFGVDAAGTRLLARIEAMASLGADGSASTCRHTG
jgi:glycosyltransferase involved in cell wall biosynthesis